MQKYGIKVNTISSGVIDTSFHSNTSKEMMDSFLKNIPLERYGIAKEVAVLIVFLVSEQSKYITGQASVICTPKSGQSIEKLTKINKG